MKSEKTTFGMPDSGLL